MITKQCAASSQYHNACILCIVFQFYLARVVNYTNKGEKYQIYFYINKFLYFTKYVINLRHHYGV